MVCSGEIKILKEIFLELQQISKCFRDNNMDEVAKEIHDIAVKILDVLIKVDKPNSR